jgi:hypothetical protein
MIRVIEFIVTLFCVGVVGFCVQAVLMIDLIAGTTMLAKIREADRRMR